MCRLSVDTHQMMTFCETSVTVGYSRSTPFTPFTLKHCRSFYTTMRWSCAIQLGLNGRSTRLVSDYTRSTFIHVFTNLLLVGIFFNGLRSVLLHTWKCGPEVLIQVEVNTIGCSCKARPPCEVRNECGVETSC